MIRPRPNTRSRTCSSGGGFPFSGDGAAREGGEKSNETPASIWKLFAEAVGRRGGDIIRAKGWRGVVGGIVACFVPLLPSSYPQLYATRVALKHHRAAWRDQKKGGFVRV